MEGTVCNSCIRQYIKPIVEDIQYIWYPLYRKISFNVTEENMVSVVDDITYIVHVEEDNTYCTCNRLLLIVYVPVEEDNI